MNSVLWSGWDKAAERTTDAVKTGKIASESCLPLDIMCTYAKRTLEFVNGTCCHLFNLCPLESAFSNLFYPTKCSNIFKNVSNVCTNDFRKLFWVINIHTRWVMFDSTVSLGGFK